jgi:hypothetical protein
MPLPHSYPKFRRVLGTGKQDLEKDPLVLRAPDFNITQYSQFAKTAR